MDTQTTERLADFFDPKEIKWKPQSVKNGKCLAVAYIDSRLVMDRLDAVLGAERWQDSYEPLTGGGMMCRLSIKFGDEWVTKTDVGSPSEQPDEGDRTKASISDALKRAAIKFGIGRYLYRLPAVWVDYDAQSRKITNPPALPEWAKPAKPKPKSMADVRAKVKQIEDGLVSKKKISPGLMTVYIVAELAKAGFKGDMDKLPAEAIEPAMKAANAFVADLNKQQNTKPGDKYPPALRGIMTLAHEVFGGETPEFMDWLSEKGVPTVAVLGMFGPEPLAKLADELGSKLAKKQSGETDDIPY